MKIERVPAVSRGSHFGCGALLGFVVGFIGFGDFLHRALGQNAVAGLVWAVVVGLVAAVFGNLFWRNADQLVWWWFWPAVALLVLVLLVLGVRSCGLPTL